MANMYGYNTSSAHKTEVYADDLGQERRTAAQKRREEIKRVQEARRAAKVNAQLRFRKMLGVAACFVMAFLIISRYVAINEANTEISNLKDEYNNIVASNQDLQAKIDKAIDLKKLQTVASEKFGMVKPERYQIFYVDMQQGDFSENIAANKADDERKKVAVTGVPGTIIGSMKLFK